jgi:hypothetical protein
MPFSASDQTAQWDQNLKTLGGALFPDPSKIAQGYYYGSEARKAQLESNKLIDQGNQRVRYGMMTQGGAQPNLPTYYTPENVPGASPIMSPPSNMPYAGSAPAAAPVANLAAIVANSTPQQAADMVAAAIPRFTTGRAAQLTGQPTAEAPPAPQTYGTDGSAPNDEGVLHPGSVTDPNGGRKQSGPAAHNGSPAPMPPGMTLPGVLALSGTGALAGFDAATVSQGASALAYELYNRGTIGRDQYHQMLGGPGGQPSMGVADIGAASAANVANINAASAARTTGMVVGGENLRAGMPLQDIVDPNDPTQVTRIPLSQLQGLGGRKGYNPNAVSAGVASTTVQPGGPGTTTYSQPAYQSQRPQPGAPGQPAQPGMPLYQQGTEDIRQTQLGAVHNFIDPKSPTVLIPATVEEARQKGYMAVPKTQEEWTSLAAYAAANAPPDQAQQIRDKVLAFATSTTPKNQTAEETNREQLLLDQQLAQHLPVPTSEFTKEPWWTSKYPAGASPALGSVLSDLTDQYFRYDPQTKGNQVTSANKAIQQLIDEKRINPTQGRTTGWITDDKTINKTVLTKDGPKQQLHFRVDLLDANGKPIKEGDPVPRITMKRSLSTAIPGPTGPGPRGPAPLVTGRQPGPAPTTTGGAPPGAVGPAPPGTAEGTTGKNAAGQALVNRGGWLFPVQ